MEHQHHHNQTSSPNTANSSSSDHTFQSNASEFSSSETYSEDDSQCYLTQISATRPALIFAHTGGAFLGISDHTVNYGHSDEETSTTSTYYSADQEAPQNRSADSSAAPPGEWVMISPTTELTCNSNSSSSTPAGTSNDIDQQQQQRNRKRCTLEEFKLALASLQLPSYGEPSTPRAPPPSPMLARFLGINPLEESLRHEAGGAMLEGRIGEDMLERNVIETGWTHIQSSHSELSCQPPSVDADIRAQVFNE